MARRAMMYMVLNDYELYVCVVGFLLSGLTLRLVLLIIVNGE